MKFGLVGLPNVGKSTIFNLVVGQELAKASNFPFCTIEPNTAIAYVLDDKLAKLGEYSKSEKTIYPRLECVDIAGLVEGASSGAGLGNQFLSHIRQVDLILHVIRCFSDPEIQHVNNKVDPVADADLINNELIISDIDICEKMLGNRRATTLYTKYELGALNKAMQVLSQDQKLHSKISTFAKDEAIFLDQRGLITIKPMLYVANVDDYTDLSDLEKKLGSRIIQLCPIADSPGIDKLIQEAYRTLGLITFYTTGKKETRGWTILDGTCAKKAAGAIHSDFEKKFIAVAVQEYDKYMSGNEQIKTEGAQYIIKNTDICDFRVGR